jgi:hypothetical protein
LSVRGRVVGAQVGPYLDPDGGKSLVAPIRRRFVLEKAPGAGHRSAASSTCWPTR